MNPSDTLSGKRVETRGRAGLLFLVVDDDALSRELLTLLLEVEGYEVETAASGEAAVARVASRAHDKLPRPGVVLTDIQMPGLAGDALAAALRPLLTPETLLLAMSGSKPAPSALTGFDGFLLKPFNVSELRSTISQFAGHAVEPAHSEQQIAQIHESETAALDEEIYSKMCELMPVAQLGQMYALCVDDARKRIARMRTLADSADDAQYRGEAHAVKGGSGMIGARELYDLAAVAEQNGLPATQSVPETNPGNDPGTNPGTNPGTTSVTATLTQLSAACDRLERILQERTRE